LLAPALTGPQALAPAPGLLAPALSPVSQAAVEPAALLAAPELASPQPASQGQKQDPASEDAAAAAGARFDGNSDQPQASADLPGAVLGSETTSPQTALRKAPLHQRASQVLHRLMSRLWPAIVEPRYDQSAPGFYHGTSFANLKAIVAGGGRMKETLSYYADESSFPRGYARSMARRTGTPGFVLQFPPSALEGKLKLGHYQPIPVSERRPVNVPKDYPKFFMAVRSVPLSDMTEGSKRTILGWMAAQRDQHPEDASWPPLIASFEKALSAQAPTRAIPSR
jgi:hypothetical protein